MALLERLKQEEEPFIGAHAFYAQLVAFADGLRTREEIETIFAIPDTGPQAAQLDVLIDGYTGAIDKGRYLNAVHSMFIAVQDPLSPLSNGQITAWLAAASAGYDASGLFGGLYVDTPQTSQSVPNNVFTTLDALSNSTAAPSAGGVVPDPVAGVITLPRAGDYWIQYSISFDGTPETRLTVAAFGGGVEVPGSRKVRELSASGGVGSTGTGTIANAPSANVSLDLRVLHGEPSARDVTVETLQLNVIGL